MLELIQQNFMGILIGTGRNNFIVEWNTERELAEGNAASETNNDGIVTTDTEIETK
jgi:segregation and condensation protein A